MSIYEYIIAAVLISVFIGVVTGCIAWLIATIIELVDEVKQSRLRENDERADAAKRPSSSVECAS